MKRLQWMIASGLVVSSATAFAHARWLLDGELKPRSDDTGLKVEPCGGKASVEAKRKELKAGESIEVKWEETVNHTGHFRIAFSPSGEAGFDDHVLKDDIPDDQNDPIADATQYHQFKTTIKVPANDCDECTLQLIQYMAESQTNYYSCADVKITGGSATTATETATETATDTSKPAAPKKLKVTVKKVGDL